MAAELSSRRSQRKGVLTRLLGKLGRKVAEEDEGGVQDALRQVVASFHEFEDAHDNFHATLKEDDELSQSESWFVEKEKDYIAGVKEARTWLRVGEEKRATKEEMKPALDTSALSQGELITLLNIPKVELDKFNGDPLEYQTFMAIFEETVDSKTEDNQVKLTRLLQYTTGAAKAAIRNCALIGGEDGYHQARDILATRFGDKYLISYRIVEDMRHGKPVGRGNSLQQLADELTMGHTALKKLKMLSEVESQQCIIEILERCPQFVRDKWRKKALRVKQEKSTYPTFADFVLFINIVASESCDPVYGSDMLKGRRVPSRGTCHNVVQEDRVDVPGEPSNNVDVRPPQQVTPCILCTEPHRLLQCEQFKAMTPQSRHGLVVQHNLCFNCLLSGHGANRCRKKSVCSIVGCGRKHTRFIHLGGSRDYDHQRQDDYQVRPNEQQVMSGVSNASSTDGKRVYLPIIPVVVNGCCVVYALLDSGSTNTFISQDLANQLQLSGMGTTYRMKTLNSSTTLSSMLVSVSLSAVDSRDVLNVSNMIVVPSIPAQYVPIDVNPCYYPHLADVPIHGGNERVDILIGMDNARALMPLEVRPSPNVEDPYAVRTMLGWFLGVPMSGHPGDNVYSHFIKMDRQVDRDVRTLWDLERDGDDETNSWSREDCKVIELWKKEIHHQDGHYSLPIPWRNGSPHFPRNRKMAAGRLKSFVRRLEQDDQLEKYEQNLLGMVEKGYAEEVPAEQLVNDDGAVWYLPHHAVVSPSKPGKLRPVFDCAAREAGVSLNSECFQGPDLINKLLYVLLRFRQYPIAVTADIEAMYLQVKVPLKDRNCLRFLWLKDGKMVDYRMTSHLFGGVWCAASSTFALRQVISDFPCSELVRTTIMKAFYVDDMLKSVKTHDEGIELVHGTKAALNQGGFNLSKFISNKMSLVEEFCTGSGLVEERDILNDIQSRALGVKWNVSRDVFYYTNEQLPTDDDVTKRNMLRKVSSMYDPLGLLSPIVLQGRALFQEAVREQLDWDEKVPIDLANKWSSWLVSLGCLSQIEFPRCIRPSRDVNEAVEVHHFADASMIGYGACSYIRMKSKTGGIHVTLLTAKSRLAPLKPTTIPRLELCAAVTAVKLDQMVRKELELDFLESTFWSDSQVVLSYIQNETSRFKVFVSNRVGYIRDNSAVHQWRYVPGVQNPADVASRGCLTRSLPSSWKQGPAFLYETEDAWPYMPGVQIEENDQEVKASHVSTEIHTLMTHECNEDPLDQLIEHYSSYYRLKKAVAWLLRVKKLLRKDKDKSLSVPLSVDELSNAECLIIKRVQNEAFSEEIKLLSKGRRIFKSSPIYALSPTLQDGVIVVGTRVKNATLTEGKRGPVILPSKHKTSLMVLREHHGGAHLGTEWTLARVRSRYWIPKARSMLKNIKRTCVTCRKLYAGPMGQKMGDLPPERADPGKPPFTYVGLDLFGPFLVKSRRSQLKRYGCVFTCFTTRAIHLEVLENLETDSFINGFMRFTARRGNPLKIWSDNGTNIVGAQGEMCRSLQKLDQAKVIAAARQREVQWYFNTPYASHQGGVWERIIRTVRRVLVAILQHGPSVTDEVLATTFCEVEKIVNSRPITKCSDDVHDEAALTPNHLLLLRENPALLPGVFDQADLYQHRWRQVQYLASVFWKRWVKEYLPLLYARQKWHEVKSNLTNGELVLIVQANTPRGLWPLGLVVSVVKGRDGLVRSARVRTQTGEFVRPVTKLVRLEGTL